MEKYVHIEKMETIRVQHQEMLEKANALLDEIDGHHGEYQSLIEYYYSDQRAKDLEDDAQNLIPQTLKRGVLSEDEIFELMGDYRDTAIRMLEIAVRMLKA